MSLQSAEKPERRNGHRHLVTEAASAQIILNPDEDQGVEFRPVDISARGLGIWTEEPLAFGTQVFLKISTNKPLIPMMVRWCKENYHNTQYYRCGLEAVEEETDLTQAWGELEYTREQPEFGQTMAMALLGTVARDIAHDINNAVHSIQLYSERLQRQLCPPNHNDDSTQKQLKAIHKNAVWIGTVVNAMRAFTSPTSAESLERLRINQVFSDVELLSSNQFRNGSVKLEFERDVKDLYITGRRSAIARAILNLVTNAFDAVRQQRNAWVKVDVHDLGDFLTIGVANQGDPMTAAKWQSIVSAYQSSKQSAHSGLGLDITLRIMHQHQGELSFDGTVDHCRITLTLPKSKKGH